MTHLKKCLATKRKDQRVYKKKKKKNNIQIYSKKKKKIISHINTRNGTIKWHIVWLISENKSGA